MVFENGAEKMHIFFGEMLEKSFLFIKLNIFRKYIGGLKGKEYVYFITCVN